MKGYRIEQADEHDFCLICKNKADKKLVGPERTFRFCSVCGLAISDLLYKAFDFTHTGSFLDSAISRDEDLDPMIEEDF